MQATTLVVSIHSNQNIRHVRQQTPLNTVVYWSDRVR